MANHLAWSYSRLKTFNDCPRQLWHNIAPKGHPDRVEYVETVATKAGNAVDAALTARLATKAPLPAEFAKYEGLAAAVEAAPGQTFTQMQLALDQSLKPCGYKDWDNAYVRVIYDFAKINGERGFLGDWKNGQIWLDEGQLRLFATVGFHVFPEVQVFDTSYIWLKHDKTSDETYHRRDLSEMWMTFMPDVERMQIAFKTGQFPATPKRGKASCKWCPANAQHKCLSAQGPYGK